MTGMQLIDIALVIIWGVFFAYWWISAILNRTPFKRQSSRFSFFTCMGVPVAAILLAISLLTPDLFWIRILPAALPLAIAGLLVTVAGLGIAVWARQHLGKNWSGRPAIRQDHTIVRTGPYSMVRHPIYTGLLCGLAGTAIATGLLITFSVTLVLLAVFIVKFRIEERFLLDEFGEDYARYMREVKALIPFVI